MTWYLQNIFMTKICLARKTALKNSQDILKSGKCDILKTKNSMTILHVKCSIGHPIFAVSYERHIVTHNAD